MIHVTAALYKLQRPFKSSISLQYVKNGEHCQQSNAVNWVRTQSRKSRRGGTMNKIHCLETQKLNQKIEMKVPVFCVYLRKFLFHFRIIKI
ncbi:MAG: hypothetical protein C6Y22_27050 [Hapalosiphonaceae cyanobacterium JJU2]|nr:MAG: hypothetical protein C6Y22_27050 [Hapalosiphonaceae cyanobacterium JJU2]